MDRKEIINTISGVRDRPEMWVGRRDYEIIVAFLIGIDVATGVISPNFGLWLRRKYNFHRRSSALAFPNLCLLLIRSLEENPSNDRCVEFLLDELILYLEETERPADA